MAILTSTSFREHLAQPVKLPQITTKPDSATTIATIDDLVRQRAAEPQGKLPIVGYPASATDYVDYSPFLVCPICKYSR